MSDKDYLDWYKNDLDLEAKINKRIEALEKRINDVYSLHLNSEGMPIPEIDRHNHDIRDEIAELKVDNTLRSQETTKLMEKYAELKDAVGILMANSIGKLNHKGYMDYRKKEAK